MVNFLQHGNLFDIVVNLRSNMHVTARAQLNSLRISPRKVRLVVDLIRGKKIDDALTELTFSKKHAAQPVKKLLESAIANAVHNHMAIRDSLKVEVAFVNEGSVLKRWMPKAMGRATPLKKRSSHITIVVGGEAMANTNDVASEDTSDKQTA